MRKLVFVAALSGSALALSACADAGEDPDEAAAAEMAEAEADADTTTADTETAGVLDANTATAEQLAAAGASEELAASIVAGQPYASTTAFNAVLLETLGEEDAAAMRANVFVPVNLNTATREDIALIPGMTERMIGEFLEYRPYENIEEFNREIGKYVDEAEVARFRQYVTL
ncbi:MAG: hypothetical protein COW16_12165 [Sphingomonadales bacterium CG12_big_fil_rev_8_21_14_0_65_65_10]|uniref:hypothetical protein n=1 Tax=Blastomonas marina TaxID=1867408 RepID=UPI000CBC1324|nr:hypothetical protein [Blastomonas marina]PIW54264.1 MAG: hypothetical protein COW16_12165 [Sphingomonadales bacterium CG12_big_fil_rev_8_21_14_0_65_65_10]WPZ04207.1 hypothetical protein T8S45_01360 [Blastomonas marina]